MTEVTVLNESRRGCGFRKPSKDGVGIYLMGTGIFEPCERLPFPLTVCPCCGGGIKFSRGFTWIDPNQLFHEDAFPDCTETGEHLHDLCPICTPSIAGNQAGLMWVGDKYYSPQSFMKEARSMGISKKIPAIPRGFEVGKHYVYLAHNKAVVEFDGVALNGNGPIVTPGVFMVFKPAHIDLVIKDENNIPDRAMNILETLGDTARLVKVVPVKEQPELLEAF